jgi:acyl-CoA thioester hydrolase
MFAVRHCEVDHFAPLRLDDVLEVHTRLTETRGAPMQAEQIIWRDGADLVRARVKVTYLDPAGRPMRLPATLRDSLTALPQSEHIQTNLENATK